MNQGLDGGRSGKIDKRNRGLQTPESDLGRLVRELGLVRERGIFRTESLQLRHLDLPLLRHMTSQWEGSETFTNSLFNLISEAAHRIPEGVARRAAVRLFGFDDEPTFARPTKWRNEARGMYPLLGADDWRKGLEQEILGVIASNIAAALKRRVSERSISGWTAAQESPLSGRVQSKIYDRSRPIFVQFLNPEILACYGYVGTPGQLPIAMQEALHATRLALLATDAHLVMPASYLFEIPAIKYYLEAVSDLMIAGLVAYCAPTRDLAAYGDQKRDEYRRDRLNPYEASISTAVLNDLGWSPRQRLATAHDITSRWRSSFEEGGELRAFLASVARHWNKGASSLDNVLMTAPDRLDGQAFISRFVARAIPSQLTSSEVLNISLFISRAYIESYLLDLDANILHDLPFGDLSCGLAMDGDVARSHTISARTIDQALKWLGMHRYVHQGANWNELLALRATAEFGSVAVATQSAKGMEKLRYAVVHSRASRVHDLEVTRLEQALRAVEMVASSLR